MKKERKKFIISYLDDSGYLKYGSVVPIDICEFILNTPKDHEEYIFKLMQLKQLLDGRGWPCKIRDQEYIEIYESKNLSHHQKNWQSNQVRKYNRKKESYSNIHYEQIDKEDMEKIMNETAKLTMTLKALKSTLNKYLD